MLLIEIQDDMIKVNEKANYFKHIIYSRFIFSYKFNCINKNRFLVMYQSYYDTI